MTDNTMVRSAEKRRPPAAGRGRKKGVPNKVTREFRETVRKLLDDNANNVGLWLRQVAEGRARVQPDPGKALDLMVKLAEFAVPKLVRSEHVGADGGPVQSVTMAISRDEMLEIIANLERSV